MSKRDMSKKASKWHDIRFPWKMKPLTDEELAKIKIEGPCYITWHVIPIEATK